MPAFQTLLSLAFGVLTLALWATPAPAFEPFGFRLRMPVGEFVAAARAQGYSLSGREALFAEVPEAEWGRRPIMAIDLERRGAETIKATFCQDRLVALGQVMPGGLNAFTRLVAETQESRGPGVPEASFHTVGERTYSKLFVLWHDKAQHTTFLTAVFTTDGEPWALRRWYAKSELCPRED